MGNVFIVDTKEIEFESWWERVKCGRPYLVTFEMHYVEGYGLAEVAAIQGISQSAVKKRLRRAREFLLPMLSNRLTTKARRQLEMETLRH